MSASWERILVVDDERDLVWALERALRQEGYQPLAAYNGAEAWRAIHTQQPDLIILDILLPDADGFEMCARLRHEPAGASVPILFLTACGDVVDRIKGLEVGGDDYLVKPFDLGEFKARIKALLRRRAAGPAAPAASTPSALLRAGPITLNLNTFEVHVGERQVQLTSTEFDLLRHFLIHPLIVFSSQELLQLVWGYPPGTAELSLVRWHIKNLREKIETDPQNPLYLRTIPRRGYVFDPVQPPAAT